MDGNSRKVTRYTKPPVSCRTRSTQLGTPKVDYAYYRGMNWIGFWNTFHRTKSSFIYRHSIIKHITNPYTAICN